MNKDEFSDNIAARLDEIRILSGAKIGYFNVAVTRDHKNPDIILFRILRVRFDLEHTSGRFSRENDIDGRAGFIDPDSLDDSSPFLLEQEDKARWKRVRRDEV